MYKKGFGNLETLRHSHLIYGKNHIFELLKKQDEIAFNYYFCISVVFVLLISVFLTSTAVFFRSLAYIFQLSWCFFRSSVT